VEHDAQKAFAKQAQGVNARSLSSIPLEDVLWFCNEDLLYFRDMVAP
jgi:hypothetical protein